jgi:hypothetical protein
VITAHPGIFLLEKIMNLYMLSDVTSAFGRNHIITVGVCLFLIILGSILIVKKDVKFEKILNIMLILWLCSEAIKMVYGLKYLLSDGTTIEILKYKAQEGITIVSAFYPRDYLPLHLCALQPLLMLIVKFTKNENLKDKILKFMFPTCILGAFIAIVVNTVGCAFNDLIVYEYFLFHTALIIYGISIMTRKKITITFKSHLETLGILIVVFISSIWVNSILSDTNSNHVIMGVEDIDLYTNFLYSMKPPMEGLPLLNLNHGWFVYFFTIVLLGLVLITLIHLPFMIKNRKLEIKE